MPKTSGLMLKPDMILAYLRGEKSQTRRTKGLREINENPDGWDFEGFMQTGGNTIALFEKKVGLKDPHKLIKLPYGFRDDRPVGYAGDTLYFKETWKMWERDEDGKDFLHYRADDAKVDPDWWTEDDWKKPDPVWLGRFDKWQSSMFMPRICSRFRDVPILNVRVERLHDITEADAKAEGWNGSMSHKDTSGLYANALTSNAARRWYFHLWDTINGKTLPAASNPWVFVYEFTRHNG